MSDEESNDLVAAILAIRGEEELVPDAVKEELEREQLEREAAEAAMAIQFEEAAERKREAEALQEQIRTAGPGTDTRVGDGVPTVLDWEELYGEYVRVQNVSRLAVAWPRPGVTLRPAEEVVMPTTTVQSSPAIVSLLRDGRVRLLPYGAQSEVPLKVPVWTRLSPAPEVSAVEQRNKVDSALMEALQEVLRELGFETKSAQLESRRGGRQGPEFVLTAWYQGAEFRRVPANPAAYMEKTARQRVVVSVGMDDEMMAVQPSEIAGVAWAIVEKFRCELQKVRDQCM
jgi:hypothetical protein